MLDRMTDAVNSWMDDAAQFAWELFEKDMAMTERILDRTEAWIGAIEQRIPKDLLRKFRGD